MWSIQALQDVLPQVVICVLICLALIVVARRLRAQPSVTHLRHRATATLVVTQSPANHSPRALAHATAALSCNLSQVVVLVAHAPFPSSNSDPNLHHLPLQLAPSSGRTSLHLAIKLFRHTYALISALRHAARTYTVQHVIVNSPPALPTLLVTRILHYFLFPTATLTLDWHNLGHTLLIAPSPLPHIAFHLEFLSARTYPNHWCVSEALSTHLTTLAIPSPTVLYDRPRPTFLAARNPKPPEIARIQNFLLRLATVIGPYNPDAPLVITATSWTPDEDFSLLLDALRMLDARHRRLTFVITGRGPLRESFEQKLRSSNLSYLAVCLAWLPIQDYPVLLASAQLGISLHASSSGMDLPMKVVDMLACGIPVLAIRYTCIHELVIDNRTGFLFDDAIGLIEHIDRLLFGQHNQQLLEMRRTIQTKFGHHMEWQPYWNRTALPTLRKPSSRTIS